MRDLTDNKHLKLIKWSDTVSTVDHHGDLVQKTLNIQDDFGFIDISYICDFKIPEILVMLLYIVQFDFNEIFFLLITRADNRVGFVGFRSLLLHFVYIMILSYTFNHPKYNTLEQFNLSLIIHRST